MLKSFISIFVLTIALVTNAEEKLDLELESTLNNNQQQEKNEESDHQFTEQNEDDMFTEDEDISISPSEISPDQQKSLTKQLTINVPASEENFKKIAILQGLNKITTVISVLRVPVNSVIKFGNLSIRVNACWKAPIESKPENKVLLRISEKIPGEQHDRDIFYGWMLSSSPALSSLSHPVYDVIALNCTN